MRLLRLANFDPPARGGFRIAAFIAVGAVVIAFALFMLRIPIAETIAEAYLADEGAAAKVRIEQWDRSSLTARIELGSKPDLIADRVIIAFAREYWLPHMASVSVVGAQAHAYFDGHSLSFGPLQHLIDNLTAKRKTAKSWTDQFVRDPLPVSINDARATIETPAGPIEIAGRIEILGPQILRAEARATPVALRRDGFSIRISDAWIGGRWTGAGFDGSGSLSAQAVVPDRSGAPQTEIIQAALKIAGMRAQQQGAGSAYTLRSLDLHAEATHWLSGFAAVKPILDARLSDLEARYEAGRLVGRARTVGAFSAQNVQLGRTSIDAPKITLDGATSSAPDGRSAFSGHLTGSAAISDPSARDLFHHLPVLGTDALLANTFVASMRAFRIDANFRLEREAGRTTLTLVSPATVASASGATLALAPIKSGQPSLSIDDRGVTAQSNIRLQGGGLPSASLALDSFSLRGGNALTASLRGSVSGSTRFFRNTVISASGLVTSHRGAFSVSLKGCADGRVGTVFAGRKPTMTDVRARFCSPAGKSLVSGSQAGWKFASGLNSISGTIVGAQVRFGGAQGHVALEGGASGLQNGAVDVAGGHLSDVFSWRRFEPLAVSGTAKLAAGVWRGLGAIKVVGRKTQIGSVSFSHTLATGVGQASIDARDVVFAPNKFAPSDISPLLVAVARADGKASFVGHVSWTPRGLKSDGQLDIDSLQFASPLGGAHGTTTHIRFVSLLPPETAPDQALGIERIEWMSPLSSVSARFRLTPRAVELGGASATVAGGTAAVDPLTFSFDKKSLTGVLKLSEIDLGTFLASSNLGSKIHVQARLSGTIPFALNDEGVRITDGFVAATKPGRISIDRSLWTSGASLSSNAMQDFAYQAMENLAFDRLQGKINSLPGGRLGLVLHIEGRNDPAKQEEARVGLFALLRGEAFKEPVPLPKGTPIDLTLDTSLNFDELLRAYQAARSPTVEVKSK